MQSDYPTHRGHAESSGASAFSQFSADGILIAECCDAEADRICATLRVLFGYAALIKRTATVEDALAMAMEKAPSLVVFGDLTSDGEPDSVLMAIGQLRNARCTAPIIVLSNSLTQAYRARLFAEGVCDAFHKDDLCSERISAALRRAPQCR